MLDIAHTKATELIQRTLNTDPRVAEYTLLPADDLQPEQFEFLYAPSRPVAAIHRINARQAGIRELS